MKNKSNKKVYDRLVERPPQYKKKLTPELTMEVEKLREKEKEIKK